MAKVILICGKICSGKSYYAREIKDKENAVILSVDEVTYDLIKNKQDENYDEFVVNIKSYLKKKTVEIIKTGSNVILDWGFWSKEERLEITKYFKNNNVKVEWHYINVDDDTWYNNINRRNSKVLDGQAEGEFYVDEGLLNKLLSKFEEPLLEEIDVNYILKGKE